MFKSLNIMRSLIINNKDYIIFISRIYNITRIIFVNNIIKTFITFDYTIIKYINIINRLQDFNAFNYITIYYITNQTILFITSIVSLFFITYKICPLVLIT